jgi:hypothetical protein
VAEVLVLASFGRSGVSAARTALGTNSAPSRAPPAGTTRVLSNWFGLAHFAPTSDVHCRHSGTGATAPAAASANAAPHEAEQGEPEHSERQHQRSD